MDKMDIPIIHTGIHMSGSTYRWWLLAIVIITAILCISMLGMNKGLVQLELVRTIRTMQENMKSVATQKN